MKKIKNDMIDTIKNLSDKDKKALVEEIIAMMASDQTIENNDMSCNKLVQERMGNKPDCPHCRAKAQLGNVVKHGRQNGVQRYYCKSCRRHFFPTTNTAFARTRKDAETWEKFILLTITGEPLKKCAEECHIAYQTAFTWRHKILNVFKTHQDTSTQMTGKVEVDEMLLPLSFKGNHIKGGFNEKRKRTPGYNNGLPRKSFKRGTDNKSNKSTDKACVFCMVENGNKTFFGAVPGVGFMKPAMLDKTIKKHVNREKATVIADQYKITMNYLEKNNYNSVILSANTSDNPHDHKPEIRGKYHLQHVNSMHAHIRAFLRKYWGVSSKYLANYIALFVWLKNLKVKNNEKKIQNISITRAATSDCYITRNDLEAYPMIPSCL